MVAIDPRLASTSTDIPVMDKDDNQSMIHSVSNRFLSNLSDNFITHSFVFNNRYWSLPNYKITARIVTVIFMVAVAVSVFFGTWAYLGFGAAYFGTALIAGGSTLGAELLLSLLLPNRKNLEPQCSAVVLGTEQEQSVGAPPEFPPEPRLSAISSGEDSSNDLETYMDPNDDPERRDFTGPFNSASSTLSGLSSVSSAPSTSEDFSFNSKVLKGVGVVTGIAALALAIKYPKGAQTVLRHLAS